MPQSIIRSILVATDLGESSDPVLASAAAIAAASGGALHVLHVLELDSSPGQAGEPAGFPDRIRQAEEALEEQLRRAVPAEVVPASRRVENYAAHKAILQHAEDRSADLIVLGPHRGGEVSDHLLGTTADQVIRDAKVPCLLARRPLSLPVRRLGVPVDFSDASRRALDVALAWSAWAGGSAAARGREVRVFHVGWPVERPDDPGAADDVVAPRLEREIEEARTRAGRGHEPSLTADVVWQVDPAEGVLHYAGEQELDLLVVGTRGQGGLKRLLVGSVAMGVAQQAPCPVLLVPP